MAQKGRTLVIGLLSLLGVVALSLGQPGPGGALETEAGAIDARLIAPCCFTQQVSAHQSAAAEECAIWSDQGRARRKRRVPPTAGSGVHPDHGAVTGIVVNGAFRPSRFG